MKTSKPSPSVPEALVSLIYQIARSICFRRHVPPDERKDFESFLFAALLSDGRRVLHRYRREGSLAAYLRVVVGRLLLDYRVRRWGKWRPSARARRLGRTAVELERLIDRDGFSRWEAVRHLRINLGVDRSELDLLDLAGRLPRRPVRRFEGEEALLTSADSLPDSERPDRSMLEQEVERVRAAMGAAVAALEPQRRRLVAQRFVEGLTIAEIARRSGADQRRLYRTLEGTLGELRERMLRQGIDRAAVRSVLDRAA
jgi:RNA polymerase sigma factor for flagellar operon FliA